MSIELVHQFVDLLPEATLVLTGEGVILAANRAVESRLGIEPRGLQGKRLSDIATDPPEEVSQYLRSCSRTRETVLGALNLASGGGAKVSCRAEGALLRPRSGGDEALIVLRLVPKGATISQFLVLNEKIEQLGKEVQRRKRVEDELRQQQEWLRVTLSSIGDAVIATDTSGRVMFMNPVAQALTGWTQEEASGRPLDDIFPIVDEQSRSKVENPVAKVLREGAVVGLANHTLLMGRDGTEHPVDDSAAPIREAGGETRGVVLVFHDISERRKAEQELRYQRELLRTVTDNADSALVMLDVRGHLTYVNPAFTRITGYSEEDIRGRPVHDAVHYKYPDGRPFPIEECPIDNSYWGLQPLRGHEDVFVRKDGTLFPVVATVAPLEKGGRAEGCVLEFRDVTREKAAEEALKEANRRKDEFLAMLAHELRNPLASINTAIQFFGKSEDTEADLEWAKEVVERQVKHLARLIDDLLDVSRITRGKISLRKEPLNLSPVVSSAVETVRPLIEERKHELNVSLAPGPLRLEADPLRLEQILVNLLSNAAKYTEAGGCIWLTAGHEGKEIVIKVRDTGIGIPPEQLPRMFELFAQGDRSMARSEGGLGIGLTLVQRLVEMHGGTVTASSEGPGQGSEFIVRLPAMEKPPVERPKSKATLPHVARQGSRVLVVDDNLDTARGLSRLLRLLGHDIQTAHDGPTALAMARFHRPEIVLLDIGLPGMDGYQVAELLRQEECCKHSLLIAISGYGQEDDRRRSREAGFDHHLVKPVDYNSLVSLISQS